MLSLEELERLCGAFIGRGAQAAHHRRRAAGAAQRDRAVPQLGARLGAGLDELTLTTNGTQLARHAEALAQPGVRRVNVSLDTLDPDRFARLTRWGRLEQVLDGLRAAKAAGLAVKINAVALRGENEDEFDDMLAWCGRAGLRSVPDRDHADGRHRRGPHRPVPAAVAGARPAAPALDAGRERYRTGGPARYFDGARDRAAARLHHADDA